MKQQREQELAKKRQNETLDNETTGISCERGQISDNGDNQSHSSQTQVDNQQNSKETAAGDVVFNSDVKGDDTTNSNTNTPAELNNESAMSQHLDNDITELVTQKNCVVTKPDVTAQYDMDTNSCVQNDGNTQGMYMLNN